MILVVIITKFFGMYNYNYDVSTTGCSFNIVFLSKNYRKFATSPSPAFGCYWMYKKITSQ